MIAELGFGSARLAVLPPELGRFHSQDRAPKAVVQNTTFYGKTRL